MLNSQAVHTVLVDIVKFVNSANFLKNLQIFKGKLCSLQAFVDLLRSKAPFYFVEVWKIILWNLRILQGTNQPCVNCLSMSPIFLQRIVGLWRHFRVWHGNYDFLFIYFIPIDTMWSDWGNIGRCVPNISGKIHFSICHWIGPGTKICEFRFLQLKIEENASFVSLFTHYVAMAFWTCG